MLSYYTFCKKNMIDMIISTTKNINNENAKQKQRKPHVFYIFKSWVHCTLIGKMLRCLWL